MFFSFSVWLEEVSVVDFRSRNITLLRLSLAELQLSHSHRRKCPMIAGVE